MAFATFRRTIGTAASVLYVHPQASDTGEGDYPSKRVALINVSAAPAVVYVGPAGVTTADGARWVVEAGRTLSLEVEVGESVYAVVAAGTQDIDVLVNGR